MAMMTRYDPFSDMLTLRDAMNRLLEESFVVPSGTLMWPANVVPVDMYETSDALVVKAYVPGFTSDQLNISIEQDVLAIHGEAKAEAGNGMRRIWQERGPGTFTRRLALPVPVDADKIQAELENGVLTLTLPKAQSSRQRKIQIKAS
jgi:HSP20 family protein